MHIVTISTGKIAKLLIEGDGPGRRVNSAIDKRPVSQQADPVSIYVGPLGLEGDEKADLNVHGGPEKALYCYPIEHYAFWEDTLARQASALCPLSHGFFGENLTIEGVLENEVFVGDVWRMGELECMVQELRKPCFKFIQKIGFHEAGAMMVRTARSGWYLSVTQTGTLKAGDTIRVEAGPRKISITQQNALLKAERRL
jgi:MOSC domain-containing protein YiiM